MKINTQLLNVILEVLNELDYKLDDNSTISNLKEAINDLAENGHFLELAKTPRGETQLRLVATKATLLDEELY
jgi:hypothetical protein